jgi:hypothetical protein
MPLRKQTRPENQRQNYDRHQQAGCPLQLLLNFSHMISPLV